MCNSLILLILVSFLSSSGLGQNTENSGTENFLESINHIKSQENLEIDLFDKSHDVENDGWASTIGGGISKIRSVSVRYSDEMLNRMSQNYSHSVEFFKSKSSNLNSFLKKNYKNSEDFLTNLKEKTKIESSISDFTVARKEFDFDFQWPDLKDSERVNSIISLTEDLIRDPKLGDFLIKSGVNSSTELLKFAWEVLTFKCSLCNVINSGHQFYVQTRVIYQQYKPDYNYSNLWGLFGFIEPDKKELKNEDYFEYSGLVLKTVLKVYFKCGIPGIQFPDIQNMYDVFQNLTELTPQKLALKGAKGASQCLLNGAVKTAFKGLHFQEKESRIVFGFNPKSLYDISPGDELNDFGKCLGKKYTCLGDYKRPNFGNKFFELSGEYFIAKVTQKRKSLWWNLKNTWWKD